MAEELSENQFPLGLRPSYADDYTPGAFDQYLTAEIVTDRGDEILHGSVTSQNRDHEGKADWIVKTKIFIGFPQIPSVLQGRGGGDIHSKSNC